MKLVKTESGYFYKKSCLNCNTEFLGNVKSKFCSLKCSCEYRKEKKSYKLICKVCEQVFYGHNPRQFYCYECKENLTTRICERCGKKFKVQSVHERKKFCNKYCERKHFFNENIFENIDTFERAYWFGFLMGDGHLRYDMQRNIRELILGLSEKDYKHLLGFTEFLEFKTDKIPIKHDKKRKAFVFRIASKKLIEDLIKNGFPAYRKTENAYVPELGDQILNQAFILGLFDADGSVFVSGKTLYISICGIDLSFIKETKSTNIYELKVGKQRLDTIKNFYKKLYSNAPVFLERKKDVFERFIKSKN